MPSSPQENFISILFFSGLGLSLVSPSVFIIGKLLVSDQIVFVGVASKHRQNAFDACNFIMDWLKTKAPFWKIEESDSQRKWVESRQSDQDAIYKWEK